MRWARLVAGLCTVGAVSATAQPLVVLDPGHGGRDPGAVGCGLEEADVVVDVGRRIRDLLADSAQVQMTRDQDVFIELRARAAFANDRNARLFISLHNNANDGAPATGTETWIANGASATSAQLAQRLQDELIATWGLRDRGVKRANFTVLTATDMPAALTEMGFINRCDPDAALLGDANERQRIAAAHARAIAAQLGVGGPVDPPPPGETGVLQGVVFEDVGVGLDDTTRRIDAARVTIDNRNLAVAAETAFWSVDLAPGQYEVRAEAPGFAAASRRCDVFAGGETWCSVGLRRGGEPEPEPEAMPEPMPEPEGPAPEGPAPEGPAPEAQPEAEPDAMPEPMPEPEGPAPEGPAPEGPAPAPEGPAPEGPAPEGPAPEGPAPETPEPEDPLYLDSGVEQDGLRASGEFCQAAPGRSSSGAGWASLLIALLLLGRRRLAGLLVALGLPVGAQAHVPDEPANGREALAPQAAIQLTEVTRLAAGPYLAVIPAPRGDRLLMVPPGMARLDWMPNRSGAPVRTVVRGAGVGRLPVWSADGRLVGVRTPEQSAQAIPMRAVDLAGKGHPPPFRPAAVQVHLLEGRVHVQESGVRYRIDGPGDATFRVEACADGAHVVGWDLRTGVWVFRLADAQLFRLGPGGHPHCSTDGRFVVFERTLDEGAVLIGGDLFLADLSRAVPTPLALTSTAERIELAPRLVGDTLFYIADGAVHRARLALPK